jgi:TRAP-type C4-dicarboxylate transport system permease small subunit
VHTLNRIEQLVVGLEKAVMLLTSGLMIVAVVLQVFFRYVVSLSVPWTEELSIICFVVMVFYGAALASYHDRHLGIRNLVDLLGERVYVAIWILQKVALVAFLGLVMVLYAMPMVLQGLHHTYTIIRIPQFYILLQIPLFGVFAAFHALMSLLRQDYRRNLKARNAREQ